MTRLRLSQEALTGLKPLSRIPIEKFRQLVTELEQTLVVSLTVEEELEKFVGSTTLLSDLTSEARSALTEAITGVHYLRLSPNSTEDDLLAAIRESWPASGNSSAAEMEVLSENIRLLAGVKVLRASFKAWSLIGDHERIFLGSRILTDIRPVFEEDLDAPLLASLVTHSLKLTMRVDGRPQTIYLAVDSDDLREFRDTIDRALAKAKFLSSQIGEHLGSLGPSLDTSSKD